MDECPVSAGAANKLQNNKYPLLVSDTAVLAGGDTPHLSPVSAVPLVASLHCLTAMASALLHCTPVPQGRLQASGVFPGAPIRKFCYG